MAKPSRAAESTFRYSTATRGAPERSTPPRMGRSDVWGQWIRLLRVPQQGVTLPSAPRAS